MVNNKFRTLCISLIMISTIFYITTGILGQDINDEHIGHTDIAVCSNGNIHVGFETGSLVYNNDLGKWGVVNQDIHAGWIEIGSDDNAYISGVYPENDPSTPHLAELHLNKTDCNGNQLKEPEKVFLSSSIWVVEDENGKFIYKEFNGVVDSQNNLHIFGSYNSYNFTWRKISPDGTVVVWTPLNVNRPKGYFLIDIDSQDNIHMIRWIENEYYNLTIGYMKFDSNGTILVDLKELNGLDIMVDTIPYEWAMKVDHEDNVNLFYTDAQERSTCFVKLNSTGYIVVPLKNLDIYHIGNIELDVGSEDNLHFVWSADNTVYYMKLDPEGNVLDGPIDVIKASKGNSGVYIGIAGVVLVAVAIVGYSLHKKKYKLPPPE